uniref:MARVEL domain-containing protein n=1 Tax=Panagrolaimus sp. PS1159 TaxID=55785 RepID=A0AC35GGD4_9BILA
MSSDAAFDYSDEERVTIVSQQKSSPNYPESSIDGSGGRSGGGGTGHIKNNQSLILSEKGTFPFSSSQNEKYYTTEIEVNGKLMRFDSSQLKNEEGCLKIGEFIVIIIALLLSGNVMGVSGERGFALFVCFIGLMVAFSIALAKVLTLNQLLDSKLWSLLELSVSIGLGIAFALAALLMAILCAFHWAENNPAWEIVPGFASVALAVASLLFFIDACLTFYNRKFRSWSPQTKATL